MKGKVLVIIPSRDFRDEELAVPVERLNAAGYEVVVSSFQATEAHGVHGQRITADLLVHGARPEEYQALYIVGGPGAVEFRQSGDLFHLIRSFVAQRKIVAAGSQAVTALSYAGILNSRRATGDKHEEREISAGGTFFTAKAVERDGAIITFVGVSAVERFCDEFLAALGEKGGRHA